MKRALFLRWSNLGAYIHDPLYVRCTGRGALNLARVRRSVLSKDRYYRRSGDGNEEGWEGAWITGDVVRDSDCTHVRRAKTSAVHTISTGPLLLRRCASSPEDAVLSPSLSSLCTRSLPKWRAFLSVLGLSGGSFVSAGDKHQLRAPNVHARGFLR